MNKMDSFRKRLSDYLSSLTPEQIVGTGGLAVLSAASILALEPMSSQSLSTSLSQWLGGLGLNVLAGVSQQAYQNLRIKPSDDELAQLTQLAKTLERDIRRQAKLRVEIGTFLDNLNALQIAEEVVQGNPAVHGWLLVQIYNDTSLYRTDLARIHSTLDELASSVKQLQSDLSRGDTVFKIYKEEAGLFLQHVRIREFQTLVNERSRNFVGRDFIFRAIDNHISDPSFPSGYVVISGEPGIGKTALIAQLVKTKGYVHHFNIASQNIRSVQHFLSNLCAQLIVHYKLGYSLLPENATKDSGFLIQLLFEVVEKIDNRPLVILVDALDEGEDLGLAPNINRFYLPPVLPKDVFFIVTTREKAEYHLLVDNRKNIYIRDNDPDNLEDVRQYVLKFIKGHQTEMSSQLAIWGVDELEFTDIITEKSQGNFMYLVHVLRDIRTGKLKPANIDNIYNLPQGLQEYYHRHWRVMRAKDKDLFDKYYQPVICILATVREPVSIEMVSEWTKLSYADVKDVISEWREFLNGRSPKDGSTLYHIYHSSFQDFLQEEIGLKYYHDLIAQAALNKFRQS